MNFGFVSADTLERTTRLLKEDFQTPTFTFTFASPSSSPLKRAVSEPTQKESDPLIASKIKPVSEDSVAGSRQLFGCLSPPFSQSKYFDSSPTEESTKTPRYYSSFDNNDQHRTNDKRTTTSMLDGHSKSVSSQLNVSKTMKPKCPSDNILKKTPKYKFSGGPTGRTSDNQTAAGQVKVEYRHCRSLTTSLSNVKSVLVPVLNSLEKLTSCSKQKHPKKLRKADVLVKVKNKNKSVETLVTQSELEIDVQKTKPASSTTSRKESRCFWRDKKATSSTNVLTLETFNKSKESYVNNGMTTSDLSVQSSESCSRTVIEASASDQTQTSPEGEDLPETIEIPRRESDARRRRRGYELTRQLTGHCFTSLLASPTEESDSQIESESVQIDTSPTLIAAKTPSSTRPADISDYTANIRASTSTAFSQYLFKPIQTAPVSSQNASSTCFPFFFPGKERYHKSSDSTMDPSSDAKHSGCFGSGISHKLLSAVRPGDKRSHSGRRKHPSTGTIKPKPSHLSFAEGAKPISQRHYIHPQASHSRFSLAGSGVPVHQKGFTSIPPATAPTTGETYQQRFRFRFSSGGHTGMKRTRQGAAIGGQKMDKSFIGGSDQSTNARSNSIDTKPQDVVFERKYPAPQYYSVDCIDAVEISSAGRFVSRLAERRSKFKDSHDQKLYRTATMAGRSSDKPTSIHPGERKKWSAPDASHQQLNSSLFSQANYNTFSGSNSGYGFVRNPNVNITINSSTSHSKTSTPTSDASLPINPQKETPSSPTAAATPGDAANATGAANNGSNFLKEQLWAFLKPTDNKLAMKLFGNKKLAYREKAKRANQSQRSWIIHPRSGLRLYWDLLMVGMLLTNIVLLPLAISFFTESILLGPRWISINCVCDVIFLTDILLNFRTGIILDSYTNKVISSPEKIARHYLRTWFVLDFVSSLPFDVFIVSFTSHSNAPHIAYAGRALRIFRLVKLVSLLRLLRLSRVGRCIKQLRVNYGQFVQLAGRIKHVLTLVCVILLLGHWNGCLQWFVPMLQHYPGDSWTALEDLKESEWTEQYTWAVFKALSHMLSIGFGRYPPQSTTDVWLTIISMLTGATCYALFVGQSTTIIQSFGISKRLYQEKFQQVEEYMSYRKLPRPLRRSINKYYEHRFRGKMFDETSILGEVNECLHEEIVNFNCRSLISSVSFFEKADQNFVSDLVAKLHSEVFLPGNIIVKEGTLGNKMFFLQEGAVSVLSKNGKCVAKLSDGSYFGEVCLLANTKRMASVRADTYCNVFTLSVEHFVSVLERYPHMRQVMESVAKQRVDDCFLEDDEATADSGDKDAATGSSNGGVATASEDESEKDGAIYFGTASKVGKKRHRPKCD